MQPIRLNHLKNKHLNQKGVILGGGPSIKKLLEHNYPFNELKNKYVIIGCNMSYRILDSHYLIFLDLWFWEKFHTELKTLQNTIVLCARREKYQKNNIYIPNNFLTMSTDSIKFPFLSKDSISCNNVGSSAISFSQYLGLSEIYLFGIDLTSVNHQNNFHNEYASKNKIINDKVYTNHYKNLEFITKTLDQRYNKKIYSCSDISLLNKNIEYVDPFSIL